MRFGTIFAAGLLLAGAASAGALELGKLPDVNGAKNQTLLQGVNKQLADQQVKDGQFEFKSGKAEFAPGNEKRVSGILKIVTENSEHLKKVFPKLKVVTQGHTDATGSTEANQKLSKLRAETVCKALEAKGMKLECVAQGFGSTKPLVKVEKTEADKQRNRRVLVQLAE